MSEFQHPPIDTSFMHDISLERDFAERAYEILSTYQIQTGRVVGDYEVTCPVTDRVEMISQDPEVESALRLVRHPTFAVREHETRQIDAGGMLLADKPSEEYIAISLQYGTLDREEIDDEEFIVDEDYIWKSYVTTVVSKGGEAYVLDSQTGKDVAPGDLIQAGYIMELLHNELRGLVFESALHMDEMPVTYKSLQTRYEDFPEGEALDLNYSCTVCGKVNTPCGCLNSQMN